MKDKQGNNFLDILLGEKLSSVIFVMDYLQLDFDGNRFTLNIWPTLTVNNKEFTFGEMSYRDKLCELIAQVVKQIKIEENKIFTIEFENENMLSISLDPNNPELITPEIAVFIDVNNKWYVFE